VPVHEGHDRASAPCLRLKRTVLLRNTAHSTQQPARCRPKCAPRLLRLWRGGKPVALHAGKEPVLLCQAMHRHRPLGPAGPRRGAGARGRGGAGARGWQPAQVAGRAPRCARAGVAVNADAGERSATRSATAKESLVEVAGAMLSLRCGRCFRAEA